MTGYPVERAGALGDQVSDDLRRRIITRELPSDTLLVESKLAEQYDVSRGPVRDAIRTLVQEGLVENRGRSARVIGLHADDVDELFALRSALEHMALDFSTQGNRDELVAALEEALEEMRDAVRQNDPQAFTRADMRFHSSFPRSAHMRRIHDMWSQFQRTIGDLLLVANLEHNDLEPSLRKHEQLAAMITAGNDAAALAELADHLNASRRRIRRDYAGAPDEDDLLIR
ncbi:GntR family transcriptional regulator [Nesterenkonia sandarakina]|uniref:DNA-binding GntR family transcriptional regulator n=1 Tax=Nesterenkonia sandarakina TaxID=272918 RepID=A0A7Z0E8Q9_9MICC|nr:GntR family transcriptional regulator [Nesterenkonia sandarakina]NYJ17145.1 DNA-binding GntR family transcriptional regulator [Nesterenkonia sandarakina]